MSEQRDRVVRELTKAGLLDPNGNSYGDMLGKAVIDLWDVFEKQGHSGMSAMMTADIFRELVRCQPLSPLTDDPDEWASGHMMPEHCSQNKRAYSCFSLDGGKTYHDIDKPRKWVRRVLPWSIYRQLPLKARYKFTETVKMKE